MHLAARCLNGKRECFLDVAFRMPRFQETKGASEGYTVAKVNRGEGGYLYIHAEYVGDTRAGLAGSLPRLQITACSLAANDASPFELQKVLFDAHPPPPPSRQRSKSLQLPELLSGLSQQIKMDSRVCLLAPEKSKRVQEHLGD